MKRPYFVYLLPLLFVFTFPLAGESQDIIFTKNKVEIKCKIEEISLDNIVKYKDFNDLNGRTHYLNKSEISRIKYGKKKSFLVKDTNQIANQIDYNSVSFGYTNFFEEHGIAIDYERMIQDDLSLRFPIYAVFDNSERNTEVFVSSGINMKYYLFKNDLFEIFAGPEVNIGSFLNSDVKLFPFQILGDVGFSVRPTDELKMIVHTGLGYESGISADYTIPKDFSFNLSISLGYNF